MHNLKYLTFVLLLSFILISCEKEDSSVVDPILTFPSILSASLYPNTFDTSAVNSVAVAIVSSEESVRRVTAKVTNPVNTDIGTFELRDNGALPDTVAGDGRYSGLISFNMSCRIVGSYRVEFLAENISGLFSNNFISNLQVENSQNLPPVISDLILVPDSTPIGEPVFVIAVVRASDPNGSCDIKEVFYTGTYPNGYSPLTKRRLYDDGSCCIIEFNLSSGDTTSNDGKYTRKLGPGAPDSLGYYRYYFRAVDRTGDSSNVLSDSIYVYP